MRKLCEWPLCKADFETYFIVEIFEPRTDLKRGAHYARVVEYFLNAGEKISLYEHIAYALNGVDEDVFRRNEWRLHDSKRTDTRWRTLA